MMQDRKDEAKDKDQQRQRQRKPEAESETQPLETPKPPFPHPLFTAPLGLEKEPPPRVWAHARRPRLLYR